MEIEIEVFFHSNETLDAKNEGEDYSLLECDTRVVTFYQINSIAPSFDEASGEWFCDINSGEKVYTATKSYEEIKQLIHESNAGKRID